MIADIASERFEEVFRGNPEIVAKAPGRVNLIGEHTDYNDGFVLPVAIDRWVAMAGRRGDGPDVVLHSVNFQETVSFPLDNLRKEGSWADYPKGVLDQLRRSGHRVESFEAAIYGNLPLEAGLSSSAAFEVVTAFVISRLSGIEIDRIEMAKLCQRAENFFVGVNCGIMDQFASALARRSQSLFIDCRFLTYEHVPLDGEKVSVVVCNSGVRRGLVDSEYNKRRAQCEEGVRVLSSVLPEVKALRDVSLGQFEKHQDLLSEEVRRRCRHVITENHRVRSAVNCLQRNDFAGFGRLMDESHASMRDDYEVSCDELNLLVEIANSVEGVLGARLTGAGFGGCTVNLVGKDKVDPFVRKIEEKYKERTGIKLETYVCSIEDGVEEV